MGEDHGGKWEFMKWERGRKEGERIGGRGVRKPGGERRRGWSPQKLEGIGERRWKLRVEGRWRGDIRGENGLHGDGRTE